MISILFLIGTLFSSNSLLAKKENKSTEQVEKVEKLKNYEWAVTTSQNKIIQAKCIVIAAGAGSFVPRRPPLEGIENFEWVLLDYVNIVVNIFNKEKREYYNIERLWADADIKSIKDLK